MPAQISTEPQEHLLGKRRRLVFTTESDSFDETHPRKLARGGVDSGTMTPRTRQMPPPGFHMPDNVPRFPIASSGVPAPGSDRSDEICDQSNSFVAAKSAKKKHKKLPPEDVKFISNLNGDQDAQALNDAEAMWHMMQAPVYGDPKCIDEEFSELVIRCAKRGTRWIKMTQPAGISATNRRFRSEHRAEIGYGRLGPTERVPLFSTHEDFDQAKAQYEGTLSILIDDNHPERNLGILGDRSSGPSLAPRLLMRQRRG